MTSVTVNFDFERNIRRANDFKLIRTSDGDTPVIEQPIRMVSCDTPEKSGYAGKPEKSQPKLDLCRERLEDGFYPEIPDPLRDYLIERLTGNAAQLHVDAGSTASEIFEGILDERLTRPDGKKRKVAVIPTGEIVDRYGRHLAYIAPWFAGTDADPLPPKDDPKRRTFNLEMIENGWAAFFPIYPSLPKNDDFNRAITAAEEAWNEQRGAWEACGSLFLLAYEFRMCIKLGTAETAEKGMQDAFQRICVDLRNKQVVGKFGFSEVPPCYRMWIWEDDADKAIADLGLNV